MTLLDSDRRAVTDGSDRPRSSNLFVGLAAAARSLVAVGSGLLLTSGIALLLWAVTPSSGPGPGPLLRGGVSAFAAGQGMSVRIGAATLTLAPMALGLIGAMLLWATTGRGRITPGSPGQELLAVLVGAVVYGAAVAIAGHLLGPAGAITPDQWWRPALLALAVLATATAVRGSGVRERLLDRSPAWLMVGLRLAGVAAAMVVAGAALVLVAGLVFSFHEATAVAAAAAPSAGDGLGMALTGLAFLPNAVLDAAGYASGAGFALGAGHYSPFGSTSVDLPAISLLTAAPATGGRSMMTLAALVVPVAAGIVIGLVAARRLTGRRDRLLAVGAGSVLASLGLVLAAIAARGGITGGAWADSGVPPLPFGAAVVLEIGLVAAAVAGLARVRPARLSDKTADETSDTWAGFGDATDDPAAVHDAGDLDDLDDADDADDADEIGRPTAG